MPFHSDHDCKDKQHENSHRIVDLHVQRQNYICRNMLPVVLWKELCLAWEGSRASSTGLCRSIWEGWCSQVHLTLRSGVEKEHHRANPAATRGAQGGSQTAQTCSQRGDQHRPDPRLVVGAQRSVQPISTATEQCKNILRYVFKSIKSQETDTIVFLIL